MEKLNQRARQTAVLLRDLEASRKRLGELADIMENEKRDLNEAEEKERVKLMRDVELKETRLASIGTEIANDKNYMRAANDAVKSAIAGGQRVEFRLYRDLFMVENAVAGGIVPIKVQDIIEPLEEGLILSKLGLPMPTGLSGEYVWPVYEAGEATVLGEGVELTDTEITWDKLVAAPQRIGAAYPVTRESINQTDGIIETVVRKVLPQMIVKLLNKIMLGREKVTNATSLAGPFVGIEDKDIVILSAEPTFKELNKVKAKVLSTGIDGEHLCWVMTQDMKATLEATPKFANGSTAICEGDKVCGLPVFCSNYVGNGYVGLGDWRYQPMGMFGSISLIVDPYSKARSNAVDFVINVDYATTTLRKEAFVLAHAGAISKG